MKQKAALDNLDTDWEQLAQMTNEDIDTWEIPPVPLEMFARGIVRWGLKPVVAKKQLTIRVDGDVLEWFKGQGRGYQTQINALLRAYMEAHQTSQ